MLQRQDKLQHLKECRGCRLRAGRVEHALCPCAGDLKRMFAEFAGFGSRAAAADMDGAKFFKLCKESKLLSKRFTAIDCDIIFAKVRV